MESVHPRVIRIADRRYMQQEIRPDLPSHWHIHADNSGKSEGKRTHVRQQQQMFGALLLIFRGWHGVYIRKKWPKHGLGVDYYWVPPMGRLSTLLASPPSTIRAWCAKSRQRGNSVV